MTPSAIARCKNQLPRLAVVLILLSCCPPYQVRAEHGTERLQQVKAAFLYNIAKFVSWPTQDKKESLLVCYFRSNPLKQGFTAIAGKQVRNLPLLGQGVGNLEQATGCDILFVPERQLVQFNAENWRNPLPALLTIADLTGTEGKRSRDSGAMINLIRQGSRIGLDIDINQVRQAPLQISSELLKIARIRR